MPLTPSFTPLGVVPRGCFTGLAPRVTHDPDVKAALLLVVPSGGAERFQALDLSLNIVGLQAERRAIQRSPRSRRSVGATGIG